MKHVVQYLVRYWFNGKESPCQCRRCETQVWPLGQEDPLEKGLAMHSSILAWRIPWTQEPGKLHSIRSQRDPQTWLSAHGWQWQNLVDSQHWVNVYWLNVSMMYWYITYSYLTSTLFKLCISPNIKWPTTTTPPHTHTHKHACTHTQSGFQPILPVPWRF